MRYILYTLGIVFGISLVINIVFSKMHPTSYHDIYKKR